MRKKVVYTGVPGQSGRNQVESPSLWLAVEDL